MSEEADWFEWNHVPRCIANGWQAKRICFCRYNAMPDCPTCGPTGDENRLRDGIREQALMEAVIEAASAWVASIRDLGEYSEEKWNRNIALAQAIEAATDALDAFRAKKETTDDPR